MIRTMAVKKNKEVVRNLPLESLADKEIIWYWVDFKEPTEEETKRLDDFFHFHPLAIEDCMHLLQRPKVDFYDGYSFYVLHALDQKTLSVHEIDLFVSQTFIVSFHFDPLKEMNDIWHDELDNKFSDASNPFDLAHLVMDHLVDAYFAPIYQIEDELDKVGNGSDGKPIRVLMDDLFSTRSDLLKLRHTILPMRDLLYRILNSQRLKDVQDRHAYYKDIYDHLLKLSEMIESDREITADIRDSYVSLNASRTNTVMMTLTIITTIFMPLTLITGIYGMNFHYIPELNLHYGYFYVLGLMVAIVLSMYWWFKWKGWFNR